MAAVEEIPQVVQKLPQVGSFNEALEAKLVDPLPQKNVNVLRQQHVEILPVALEDGKAVSMKRSRPDRRATPQAALHAGFKLRRGVFSEGDGQDLVRPGVSVLD